MEFSGFLERLVVLWESMGDEGVKMFGFQLLFIRFFFSEGQTKAVFGVYMKFGRRMWNCFESTST